VAENMGLGQRHALVFKSAVHAECFSLLVVQLLASEQLSLNRSPQVVADFR
jgi:hypothetical protein